MSLCVRSHERTKRRSACAYLGAGLGMIWGYVLGWGGGAATLAAEGPIVLADVTHQTGISFRHTDGSRGHYYIIETVTGGVVTFDYDNDGLIDIYFTNGIPLGDPASALPRHALYRNQGRWLFRDVSSAAGVDRACFGLGATTADYDNDGHPDLYLSTYGPNVLYHNRGDGRFSEVTTKAGVGRGHKTGAGTCFLDYDADGFLDLYAANYVRFTPSANVMLNKYGVPLYPGPRCFEPEPDDLFRNRGDGTFEDVGQSSGIAQYAGTGMGAVAFDYDRDGDTDIFVANDCRGNFLYRNVGNGRFDEVALAAGVAYNGHGDVRANMGADTADYDHDGWPDLFVTNYQRESAVLYRNLRDGTFEDVTSAAGLSHAAFNIVKWGPGFADFDNDGDMDLFVATGHIQDQVARIDDSTSYEGPNVILENLGNGKFRDVSSMAGSGLRVVRSSRGLALDDLDNDGRIDVVVCNIRSEPTLLRNETANGNHWVQIRLTGTKCNRDGVGSQVTVVAGKLVQTQEVHSGRGYQGHFGSRLHFGLGPHDRLDRIEVRWLGGSVDVLEDLPADRLLNIVEGGRLVPGRFAPGPTSAPGAAVPPAAAPVFGPRPSAGIGGR